MRRRTVLDDTWLFTSRRCSFMETPEYFLKKMMLCCRNLWISVTRGWWMKMQEGDGKKSLKSPSRWDEMLKTFLLPHPQGDESWGMSRVNWEQSNPLRVCRTPQGHRYPWASLPLLVQWGFMVGLSSGSTSYGQRSTQTKWGPWPLRTQPSEALSLS